MLAHLIKNLFFCLILFVLFSDHLISSHTVVKRDDLNSTTVQCSSTCNTTCYNASTQQCVNNSIVCPSYTPVAICNINAFYLGPNASLAQCYNPYFEYCQDNSIVCSLDEEVCMVGNWRNYVGASYLVPQCYDRTSQICFDNTTVCSFVDQAAARLCHNPDCFNSSTQCSGGGVSGGVSGWTDSKCNCGVYTQCYDKRSQTCASGGTVCNGLNQSACNVLYASNFSSFDCYDPRYEQCYNNSIQAIPYNNSRQVQYHTLVGMVILLLTVLCLVFGTLNL
jgi:hypothetical protein